jgi:hypothetical protein
MKNAFPGHLFLFVKDRPGLETRIRTLRMAGVRTRTGNCIWILYAGNATSMLVMLAFESRTVSLLNRMNNEIVDPGNVMAHNEAGHIRG